jgi:hypothetical protein
VKKTLGSDSEALSSVSGGQDEEADDHHAEVEGSGTVPAIADPSVI